MGKSPAFRFYPGDFWSSPDVQAMDLHEVGAYLSLMSASWLGDQAGCLPDDQEKLRRWARMSREQWGQSRETLLSKFPVHKPGTRINPRLYREAEKQAAFSASQSEKGRKGGRPKAAEKPELSGAKPGLYTGLSPEKPSVSVSAFVSEEQELYAPAPQAPISCAPEDKMPEEPKTLISLKARTTANTSDVERVWAAYPVKKGKAKALPVVMRSIAAIGADELIARVERDKANRAKATGFVPDWPYPQKYFGHKRWDDDDLKPKPRAEFVEVAPEEWLGPEGRL